MTQPPQEPKIKVSQAEYNREVRQIQEYERLIGRPVIKGERGILWSDLGRAMAYWRWRRQPVYLEQIRATWARIKKLQKELHEARIRLGKKVVSPYWRIDVAYQFQKTTHEPPYHFYAEFRKYLFTRTPENYADWDEATGEFKLKPDVQRDFEFELKQIMFATSLMSRVTKTGEVAHASWVEALLKMKSFPFPNIEIAPVPQEEVTAKEDVQQYYVRFEEEVTEPPKGEYGTAEVSTWLRRYTDWLEKQVKTGQIKHPEAYLESMKQRTLDQYVEEVKKEREKAKEEKKEGEKK
jgi:hypothetical protein